MKLGLFCLTSPSKMWFDFPASPHPLCLASHPLKNEITLLFQLCFLQTDSAPSKASVIKHTVNSSQDKISKPMTFLMPINPTAPFPSAALNFLDSFKAVVCIWTWLPLTVQYSHSLSDFSLKNCRPWSLHVFWNLWRNLKIRSLSFFFLLENFQPEKISLKWPNNWCLFFKFPVLNKEKKLNSLINFKLWEKYILLEEDTAIWAQNSDCIYTSLQWKKKNLYLLAWT